MCGGGIGMRVRLFVSSSLLIFLSASVLPPSLPGALSNPVAVGDFWVYEETRQQHCFIDLSIFSISAVCCRPNFNKPLSYWSLLHRDV